VVELLILTLAAASSGKRNASVRCPSVGLSAPFFLPQRGVVAAPSIRRVLNVTRRGAARGELMSRGSCATSALYTVAVTWEGVGHGRDVDSRQQSEVIASRIQLLLQDRSQKLNKKEAIPSSSPPSIFRFP